MPIKIAPSILTADIGRIAEQVQEAAGGGGRLHPPPAFGEAGGDSPNVQVEAPRHLHRVVELVRRLGARAGVALSPNTPLGAVEDVLDQVDQVMIMAVNPGWGGQSFIESSLGKVQRLRGELDRRGLGVGLEGDGGVN